MTVEESFERYGLIPNDAALPEIRALLSREAELERSGRGDEREVDLALLCCVQLFARGLPEDILHIWDAKQSGFDLACYLDGELLCGAGIDATKAYLAAHSSAEAAAALEYIRECEASWRTNGFSPERRLDYYRTYFRNSSA